MNWTKVGLKVIYSDLVRTILGGLNWTKVGLKEIWDALEDDYYNGLNWTKVGLKERCPVGQVLRLPV